jgi:zinc protease
MSVVRNELERGENYPDEALEKDLYAIAFREHPYHHPTIGWRSDVEGVPMSRLKEFYDTFYWPNNATLILLGDFQTDEALKTIEKNFGKIPPSARPIPDVYTTEPPQEGERRFTISRAGDLPRAWVGYHVPQADHPDNYALAAMRHILGGTYERSSRLYKSLIDSGIACDSFARHHDLRDPGLFIVGAMLNPDQEITKAESILHAELDKLASEPVTPEELQRAKSANRKGTILAKADPSSLAFMLGEAESKSDWLWLINYDEKFDNVQPEDILRVARQYFKEENRTVGHFIPKIQQHSDSAIGPQSEPVKAELPVSDTPHQQELSKLLETQSPIVKVKVDKPKKITTNFQEQVIKKILPNGLTLLLLRNPDTQSVAISGVCRGGKHFSHEKNSNLADIAIDLLPKGSKNHSKTAIAEILEGMAVPSALDFSIDNFRISFSTNLVTTDLPVFLELLADVIRYPNFAKDEFGKTKLEWQAKYAEAMNSTKMLAWNALRRNIYSADHPFSEKTFEEQLLELDQLALEEIKELHQSVMLPNSTIISIVGDFEIEQTIALFEQWFGDWSMGETRVIAIPKAPLLEARRRIEISLADKKSVDIVMGHPSELRRTGADFYAAKIANAALGQDTITSRLGQIVRDRAGLTYGIYSSFSDSAYGQAPRSVSLTVNAKNIDRALALVSEVLADYIQNGISKDELNKEVGRAVGSFKVGLASSLGIARALTEFEFLGLGVGELDNITKHYLAITKEQVDKAMRHYMHPEKAVTVIAGTLK